MLNETFSVIFKHRGILVDLELHKNSCQTSFRLLISGFNLYKRSEDSVEGVMGVRRKHMTKHFDDLTHCYFSNRVQKVLFPPESQVNRKSIETEEEEPDGLYEFSSSLNNFTRYSGLRYCFVDLILLTFDQFWTFFQIFGHVKLHHRHVQQCQHCQFDRI